MLRNRCEYGRKCRANFSELCTIIKTLRITNNKINNKQYVLYTFLMRLLLFITRINLIFKLKVNQIILFYIALHRCIYVHTEKFRFISIQTIRLWRRYFGKQKKTTKNRKRIKAPCAENPRRNSNEIKQICVKFIAIVTSTGGVTKYSFPVWIRAFRFSFRTKFMLISINLHLNC